MSYESRGMMDAAPTRACMFGTRSSFAAVALRRSVFLGCAMCSDSDERGRKKAVGWSCGFAGRISSHVRYNTVVFCHRVRLGCRRCVLSTL